MITANPGNPLKPLAKVASGGEVSRIMLAIKAVLNQDLPQGCIVFDEIDTGISGRVAETVGLKLNQLGKRKQVICITHSPQIASIAKSHFKVEKEIVEESSQTRIRFLNQQERIEEIAQFLGGSQITEKTRSAAKEMLKKQK